MSNTARRERRRFTAIEGRHFLGRWTAIAGNTGGSEELRITAHGDLYELKYFYKENSDDPGRWRLLQQLVYMPDTRTLENRVDDDGLPRLLDAESERREPERCITFWNCIARNRGKSCTIFAMRIGQNPGAQSQLPPFEQGATGSWGAEEGGA